MARIATIRRHKREHSSVPGLLIMAIFFWCLLGFLSLKTMDMHRRIRQRQELDAIHSMNTQQQQQQQQQQQRNDEGAVKNAQGRLGSRTSDMITLHLSLDPPVDVRLKLYAKEAPDAARFVKSMINSCSNCNLYRAEPVPSYWGSPAYPDRWFDNGRWGPPYALLQGQFQSEHSKDNPNAVPENHRPTIQKGMVAWSGGKGGPHFFIALADHPEWKQEHTVWAKVLEEDMSQVQLLVQQQPLKTVTPKQPPILSYLVTPINFTVT